MTKKYLFRSSFLTIFCATTLSCLAQETQPAPSPAETAPAENSVSPAAAAEDPPVETPVPAAPTTQPPPTEETFSVMTVEAFLKRAAVKFKLREKAKAGGILLEAAEWLDGMAGSDREVLAAEVRALQDAALSTARGDYPEKLLNTLSANSTIRLALVEHRRSQVQWNSGNLRVAGSAWRNALAHLEKTIDLMGFGLQDAGADTMTASKSLATAMASGEPVDPDAARQQAALTGKMIHEVGRNLAAQNDGEWNFKTTAAPAAQEPKKTIPRSVPSAPKTERKPAVASAPPPPKEPTAPTSDVRQKKGAELQKAIQGLEELNR